MAFNYDSNASVPASHGGRDGIEMVPLNSSSNNSKWDGTPPPPATPRTPKRILSQRADGQSSANQTPKKIQFSTPEVHTVPPSPSMDSPRIMLTNRKREEALVLANLKRFDLGPNKKKQGNSNHSDNGHHHHALLDNRPSLPKISLKAVSDSNNNCNIYDDSSSVKAAAGATSGSTTTIQDKDFILELLCWHNEYRARHAVTALSISSELCEYAQTWANHIAQINEFYYRSDKTIGQNLFCCPISALVTDLTGQEVAAFWYSTVRKYNYYKESHLLHTNVNAGHFAQMIWASSRYLGVGKASSKTGKIFVVAFYFPPGNQPEAYHMNVPPPIVEQEQISDSNSKLLLDGENNPIPSILKQ